MHGFEVLQELKKDTTTKDIPIIVLTNLESMGDVEKALELGATTYLVKASYTLEEVVDKIKKAIGIGKWRLNHNSWYLNSAR